MARRRFNPESDHAKEVMRRDAERIKSLWAQAKAKYDEEEEVSATAKAAD